MGLAAFRRRRDPEPEQRQAFWNLAGIPGLIAASAYMGGSEVEKALRNAASWACIDVIADAVSRTPFNAVRGKGSNTSPVTPAPMLIDRPSEIVARDVWRYQLAWSLLTDGNAFGQILTQSASGYPTQVEWLDPFSVMERAVKDGVPGVRLPNGQWHGIYPYGEVFHVPGRMVPAGSPFALSPVAYANKSIGTSLGAEDFSYQFFTNGAHPSAIISSKSELTAEQAGMIKDAARRAMSGRDFAVMGADLTYQQIQAAPESTNVIEILRFQVEQACRFWRVPPSMVYGAVSGQSVTYANVSQSDLAYLKHSLDGYYVRVEEALTDALPKPQYVIADRNAILRNDVETRHRIYDIRLRNKSIAINEVRDAENEPRFSDPEFDKPGIPGGPEKDALAKVGGAPSDGADAGPTAGQTPGGNP